MNCLIGLVVKCQTCGPGDAPNYGCDKQTNGSTDHELTEVCSTCGIWEEWGLNPDGQWRMLVRRRTCMVGSKKTGCTYWYPAGTKGYVHEICKCRHISTICNLDKHLAKAGKKATFNITDIGGLGHPSKFPPQKRNGKVVLKVLNGTDPRVSGILHWFYFLLPLLYLVIIS